MRSRGRGAAGSRGAGGSRMYMPNGRGTGFRRHPAVVSQLLFAQEFKFPIDLMIICMNFMGYFKI